MAEHDHNMDDLESARLLDDHYRSLEERAALSLLWFWRFCIFGIVGSCSLRVSQHILRSVFTGKSHTSAMYSHCILTSIRASPSCALSCRVFVVPLSVPFLS